MKINKKFLLLAFAISGFTALVYEIIWSRPLQLIFGSTTYAVSTILTTFFVGFALGSYVFRNIADDSKNPLIWFGLVQAGIGVYGLIILGLFKVLTPIYLFLEIPGLQFALLFMILIIPALLFGATWPLMNKAYVQEGRVGKDAGKLYSYNSLGSSIGPVVAGFFLIPWLGVKNTSLFAASTNVLIGIIILIYTIYTKKVKE